jgi:hypothetical protein
VKKQIEQLEKEWNEYLRKHEEATKEALESIKMSRVGLMKVRDEIALKGK